MDFQGKKIAILGLGISGLALAKFFDRRGIRVVGCDRDKKPEHLDQFRKFNLELRLGPEYLLGLEDFDIIFVSPGVPKDLPEIRRARNRGVEISSEIQLFFKICPCDIVGITGTNGKSTTTTLVGEFLKTLATSGRKSKVLIGGNIEETVIDKLDELDNDSLVVLELSSFQLEDLKQSPHIAVFLNITPDHLDRHESFESYLQAKCNIFRHQKNNDFLILNFDDPQLTPLRGKAPGNLIGFSCQQELKEGAFLLGDKLQVRWKDKTWPVVSVSDLLLPGQHNISNVLASIMVATLLEVPLNSIREILLKFKGLEHRIEFVDEIDGVKYYNDSKATTPHSTIAALRSFQNSIILIAGGYDKQVSFQELAKEIVKSQIHALILLGETADKIERAVLEVAKDKIKILKVPSLKEAVKLASQISTPSDIVLFSPACASFDMFKNFKQRGKIFKDLIKALSKDKI